MIHIKTQKDITAFTKNVSVDFSYSSYVADYFNHLMKTFSDGEAPDNFSLEDTGHIIILESSDAIITCLNDFGISDIFTAPIEYCNFVELHDETGKPHFIAELSLYQQQLMLINYTY